MRKHLHTSEGMPSVTGMIIMRVLRRGGLTKIKNSAGDGQV